MLTLSLDEASSFLKLHPQEVSKRARLGILPGAKVGRRWVFIETDLADYLRSLYPTRTQAVSASLRYRRLESWHSTNAKKSGGSTSPLQAANALERLLAAETEPRRKNCMTS
ncbi:helix-turn-helix domain-containing protein [Thiomonas sp.]